MINVENLKKTINEDYNGSCTMFAKEIGVSTSTITRLLKGERDVGINTTKKIIAFCKRNNRDSEEYIFLQ